MGRTETTRRDAARSAAPEPGRTAGTVRTTAGKGTPTPGTTRKAAARGRIARSVLAAALVFGVLGAIGEASALAEVPPRVDLNQATVEELMSLPGVGAAKAQAIVEHRKTAPFRKPEELLEVRGIGDSVFAGLRDRITVSGAAAAGGTPPSDAGSARETHD